MSKNSLIKKRDKLQTSVFEAAQLATTERDLADRQHLAAHMLEKLADDLEQQLSVVEAEIKQVA